MQKCGQRCNTIHWEKGRLTQELKFVNAKHSKLEEELFALKKKSTLALRKAREEKFTMKKECEKLLEQFSHALNKQRQVNLGLQAIIQG